MFENILSKVISENDLEYIRNKHKDKKIVFCSGCFDILQSGHAVFFNQCKQNGDILVVGIGRDIVISNLKGPGRPVNPENNRLYLVASLQDVDYAVLNGNEIKEGKIDFENIVSKLRPDVFVLNDDDSAIKEKHDLCNKYGISFVLVSRIVPPELHPTSTTHIIDKINFAFRAPLRIDFAGGWTDVPYVMNEEIGYVSNIAISPLIEFKNGKFNMAGYPRGSGLSTSTAVKAIELISSKNYNSYSKSLFDIAEDLFQLENKELKWAIGRQDQYAIVFGGFHCFEFGQNYAKPLGKNTSFPILEEFKKGLLLMHTGTSRNAQSAVEQVYYNCKTIKGKKALRMIAYCGFEFYNNIQKGDFLACAEIMNENFKYQKELASASSNEYLNEMYLYALKNGAYGGKICGAGGGGAFVFYSKDPDKTKIELKTKFPDCFEIDFDFEYRNIKKLNYLE